MSQILNDLNELDQIDSEKFNGDHSFLSQELLIPNLSKADGNRSNMFCSHIHQTETLKNAEFPRVFTGFENQVGEYSTSYKKASKEYTIVDIIERNPTNKVYIIKSNKSYYDIVNIKPAENITENYGYKIINELEGLNVNDKIPKNQTLYRSNLHDQELNFTFGLNLNAVFTSYKGLTTEDAIVISKSVVDRSQSFKYEEIEVTLNDNDILCNIYGTNDEYKCFPDINEEVKTQVLLSRRRQVYDSMLYDADNKNLQKVNYNTDTIFFSKGKVVDIEIFSNNNDIDSIRELQHYKQILKYYDMNNQFYKKFSDTIDAIKKKDKDAVFSEDLLYLYKRYKDITNPEIQFKYNKKDFGNIIMIFKVLREDYLKIGSKITTRYGGKGTISAILPDEEMPVIVEGFNKGKRAEIILNLFGVINRKIPAQLYEQEINFITENLVAKCKEILTNKSGKISLKNEKKAVEIYFDILRLLNKDQCEYMKEAYNNLEDDSSKKKYWKNVIKDGLYIHQPPFFGNIKFLDLVEIYKKYDWIEAYKFDGIERRLLMGKLFFMKLKHHPKTKFSARSTSYLNIKNIPSKSITYKANQQIFSKTPIRMGEMEVTNLLLCDSIDHVVKLIKSYSTDEKSRKHLIETLLTKNVFDLKNIKLITSNNKHNEILEVFLKCMGLSLKDTEEEDKQKIKFFR